MPDPNKIKIATIIGARPQFIKAATITRCIMEYNRNNTSPILEEILVHTGQHYDTGMSDIFFRELEIPEPDYNLNVGSGLHGRQTGEMLSRIEGILIKEKPDWVLIYGDTNSTLAGALAAAKLHIPIAHVEAGLRSFNRQMPEEINRIIADKLSHLLFCPSQVAVDNLVSEGIAQGVVITGDVMYAALHFAEEKALTRSNILARLNLEPKNYLLATVHRAENTDNLDRLENILRALSKLSEKEIVVIPLHPRTKKIINENKSLHFMFTSSLKIIDPIGYFDIVSLQKSARVILTDSGGVQKEAYWLKTPCVTLREETEWIETTEKGWNVIAGSDTENIINAVTSLKTPLAHPPLYGDDKSPSKCINELLKAIC